MTRPRICSIPGCDRPHEARTWCANHYYRWHRYGDPTHKPPPRAAGIARVPLSTSLPERLEINRVMQNRFDNHPITLAKASPKASR